MINEINRKFDSGWEIDYEMVKNNLAESLKQMSESRIRKIKASAYKSSKSVIPGSSITLKKYEEITQKD